MTANTVISLQDTSIGNIWKAMHFEKKKKSCPQAQFDLAQGRQFIHEGHCKGTVYWNDRMQTSIVFIVHLTPTQ